VFGLMSYWYVGLHVTVGWCRSSEDFPNIVWVSAGHRGGQDGSSFLMHRCVLLVSWFLGTCYYERVPSVILSFSRSECALRCVVRAIMGRPCSCTLGSTIK